MEECLSLAIYPPPPMSLKFWEEGETNIVLLGWSAVLPGLLSVNREKPDIITDAMMIRSSFCEIDDIHFALRLREATLKEPFHCVFWYLDAYS